jgi:hypothetical protein
MVRPERFELPTYCSGGNRSIQTELRALTKISTVYMGKRRSINLAMRDVAGGQYLTVSKEIAAT